MSARLRRVVIIAALAGSALTGARVAVAGFDSTESSSRSGLTACVLVDEAVKLGQDPKVMIPATAAACVHFRERLRFAR